VPPERSAVLAWVQDSFEGWHSHISPEQIEDLARELGIDVKKLIDEWGHAGGQALLARGNAKRGELINVIVEVPGSIKCPKEVLEAKRVRLIQAECLSARLLSERRSAVFPDHYATGMAEKWHGRVTAGFLPGRPNKSARRHQRLVGALAVGEFHLIVQRRQSRKLPRTAISIGSPQIRSGNKCAEQSRRGDREIRRAQSTSRLAQNSANTGPLTRPASPPSISPIARAD
jgi:hypothetical protein